MNTLIVGAAWSSLLGATGVLVKSFEDVVEVHRDAPCNILFVYPKAWQGSGSRISSRGASASGRKTLTAAPYAKTRQLVGVLTDLVRIGGAVLCSGMRLVKPTKISAGRVAPTYLTWKQQSEGRVPSKGSRHTDRQRLRQRQASFCSDLSRA